MAKSERTWHPEFIRYMEFIVKHKNYQGVDSQRNVPVFSQRILPDTESGLNQYLKKQ
mgnify:FL=1